MIAVSISFLALLWLNSLVAQVLLVRAHHPVSFVAFVCWSVVYAAIGVGLARRVGLARWFGLVLSVLQLVPALLWVFSPARVPVGSAMPSWYPVSLWLSFGFGVGLFLSLLATFRQHHTRTVPPGTA